MNTKSTPSAPAQGAGQSAPRFDASEQHTPGQPTPPDDLWLHVRGCECDYCTWERANGGDPLTRAAKEWAEQRNREPDMTAPAGRDAAAPTVEAQWVMVPKVPTRKMTQAAAEQRRDHLHSPQMSVDESAQRVWEAMLAAAPSPSRPDAQSLHAAIGVPVDAIFRALVELANLGSRTFRDDPEHDYISRDAAMQLIPRMRDAASLITERSRAAAQLAAPQVADAGAKRVDVLQQAYAALVEIRDACTKVKGKLNASTPDGDPVHDCASDLTWPMSTAGLAIDAIAATLATPQEVADAAQPVAWMRTDGLKAMPADEKAAWIEAGQPDVAEDYTTPLYSSPPAQQDAPLSEARMQGLADYLRAQVDAPVAEWQYRTWRNGEGGEPVGWDEWQRIKPRTRLQTLEQAVDEFRGYIANGNRYEIRALFASPPPQPARMGRLWIDTEFNEFRGELISIAIVDEEGREFYEVLPPPPAGYGPWVAQHVVPILGKPAIQQAELKARLHAFLARYPCAHLIADWPEDIEHFLRLLIVGPGERIGPDRWTMEVRRDLPSTADISAIPHNALEDAKALRRAHLAIQGDSNAA